MKEGNTMNATFVKRTLAFSFLCVFMGVSILPSLQGTGGIHGTGVTTIDMTGATLPKDTQAAMTTTDTSFVIIAPQPFYDYSGTWNLQRLADWHTQNDTLDTYVINLADILENSSYWVNGDWGDGNPDNPFKRDDEDAITQYNLFNDSQAKIRNYLRYAYITRNVRYALLVGDADDGNPLFPIRECYSMAEGAPLQKRSPQYELIPTDAYYAGLHGTFNADEDANSESSHSGFGENATESTDGIDECDWDYDIAVGRFPVDDTTELSNIVRKTISYMSTDASDPYLQNITLAGQGGGFGGITTWMANYSKTLNGTTYSSWKDGATTHGFTSENCRIKILDANPNREEGEPFYDTNSRGDFNNGVHIFYESSHGSTSGWAASGGEGESFTITDVQALTNTKFCFVMSAMPCNTATFDESADPFSEVFITDEHGAFAYLGNTRYGFGSYAEDGLNSSSHRLGSEIIDALFNTTERYLRIGDLVGDSKRDVRNWCDELGDQSIRYAMYEHILFGSPAVMIKSLTQNQPPAEPTIDGPTSGEQHVTYVFTISSAIDPDGDEISYYVDWGDDNNSGWLGPVPSGVPMSCSHAWSEAGSYTIKAKVKDTYGMESGWTSFEITIGAEPGLEIRLNGGLGITALMKNTGAVDLTNVTWEIVVEGRFGSPINKTGAITVIPPDTQSELQMRLFGLGKKTITVRVTADGGITAEKTGSGFLFLFLLLGVK